MRRAEPLNAAAAGFELVIPIGYAIAVILFTLPLLELGTTIWPLRPDSVLWRLGSAGLLTQALTLPMFGVFGAMLIAHTLEHRRLQLALAGFAGLLALVLLAGLVMFAITVAQARALPRPEIQQTVAVTAIRTIAAGSIYMCLCAWLAAATLRDYRAASPAGPA